MFIGRLFQREECSRGRDLDRTDGGALLLIYAGTSRTPKAAETSDWRSSWTPTHTNNSCIISCLLSFCIAFNFSLSTSLYIANWFLLEPGTRTGLLDCIIVLILGTRNTTSVSAAFGQSLLFPSLNLMFNKEPKMHNLILLNAKDQRSISNSFRSTLYVGFNPCPPSLKCSLFLPFLSRTPNLQT